LTPSAVEAGRLVSAVGWFEIVLGVLVLVRPVPLLLRFAFVWKIGTELLRPLAGEPLWEFVERGGSYAAPLLLLYVRGWSWAPGAPNVRAVATDGPHRVG
jgi:hypothetical protein